MRRVLGWLLSVAAIGGSLAALLVFATHAATTGTPPSGGTTTTPTRPTTTSRTTTATTSSTATKTTPGTTTSGPVIVANATYTRVEGIFDRSCSSCHPGLVPSLDLRPDHAYRAVVGVQSVEQPAMELVVAGDPGRSLLYLKLAGWPGNGADPAVGGRMPPDAPLSARQIATIRTWIEEGARDQRGQTSSVSQVSTPGNAQPIAIAGPATEPDGGAAVGGTVYGPDHRPLENAIVTLLVPRTPPEAGLEHVQAAVSGSSGGYVFRRAPPGRILLVAYAAGATSVSRVVVTEASKRVRADVGLPKQATSSANASNAVVQLRDLQLRLSLRVSGAGIARGNVLAVNTTSGHVYELRPATGRAGPGSWGMTVPRLGNPARGSWIFFVASTDGTVSRFIPATGS